jgi:hypothetical protein
MSTNHTPGPWREILPKMSSAITIYGDSIKEAICNGVDPDKAVEQAEGNAFENAIARGLIGSDAWLVKGE